MRNKLGYFLVAVLSYTVMGQTRQYIIPKIVKLFNFNCLIMAKARHNRMSSFSQIFC